MGKQEEIVIRVKEDVQRLTGQTSTLKDNDQLNDKQLAKINDLQTNIQRLLSKETWNLRDINELRTALKKWNGLNSDAALSVTTLTEAEKKWKKELKALEKTENNAHDALIDYEYSYVGKSTRDNAQHYNVQGLRRKYAEELFNRYQRENAANGKAVLSTRGKELQFDTFWNYLQKHQDKLGNLKNSDAFIKILEKETQNVEVAINKLVDALQEASTAVQQKRAAAPEKVKTNNIAATNTAENDKTQRMLDDFDASLTKVKDDGDNTSTSITNLNKNIGKQQTALSKAFKAFTIYNIVLRAAKSALREATSTIRELDKSLTEQAMVTGKTRKETYGLVKEYQRLALQVGATTKEVSSVATEYMKQGKTVKDSLVLTEAAISAAKVARVSVGDSVNYLTTALNGFQMAAEQAMLVSDKFAAVAASSATDYDELAIALSKVASQANLAGMSIDYTTALLTKGLETTREAPETMGTALKTIIARMREMTDYGQTLEDGVDINNVEKQLSYVGIALRNEIGELRSTEDVLDELGKKWDTLNKNQQAAVAKALAGTRQQSRLIAMMTDYERVTELQETAARSAGATMAQAGTYLEGIEASMNKISVAWEKIITGLTNSDFIVWLLDRIGTVLDTVSRALNHWIGQFVFFAAIGVAMAGIIAKKQVENQLAKEQMALQRMQYKEALKKRELELIIQIAKKKDIKLDEAELKLLQAQYQAVRAKKKAEAGSDGSDEFNDSKTLADEADSLTKALKDQNDVSTETLALQKELGLVQNELNYLEKSSNDILGAGVMVLAAKNMWQGMVTIGQKIMILVSKKETKANWENVASLTAKQVAMLGIIGVAITATAVIGGLVLANIDWRSSTEKTTEQIQKLSNEIYKLDESARKIDSLTDSFDALDKKLIKTNKDFEEMKKIGENLAESIDFTIGGTKSQKDADAAKADFMALTTVEAQIKEAKRIQTEINNQIKKDREAIIKKINKGNIEELLAINSNVNALRANNNVMVYEEIDRLKDSSKYTAENLKTVESLMNNIFADANEYQILEWASDKNGTAINNMVDTLAKLNDSLDGKSLGLIDQLFSSDTGLLEKKEAYDSLIQQITDPNIENTLKNMAGGIASLSEGLLSVADHFGLSAEKLNDFEKGLRRLGVSKDDAAKKMEMLLQQLNNGMDIEDAISSIFGVSRFDINGEENKEYIKYINIISDAISQGINNISQNLDGFDKRINRIYETASKWDTLNTSEQANFITENADLFKDENTLKAFESGDYTAIEAALQNNEALMKERQKLIKDLEHQIVVEQDETMKKFLQNELKRLQNEKEVFKADLKARIDAEQKQLNIYKDFLNKQKEALNESLDQRKEAYNSYFKATDEKMSNDDYIKKYDQLAKNLSQIGSTTDAATNAQRQDLEDKLMELTKEREKELRERAKDAMLDNLDNTANEINNKFDKLLKNEELLLKVMQSSLIQNPELLNSMASVLTEGVTKLQMQEIINNLQSTLGPLFSNVDWDRLSQQVQNNANINIQGDTINMEKNDSNILWQALKEILVKLGYGS